MAQSVEFRLNTSLQDARWMRGEALSKTIKVQPQLVRAAIGKAMQPGLAALRSNVNAAKVKTGRLKKSPGIVTRKYGGAGRLIIVGLVGYRSGVAPHSKYLELGTPPRSDRGKVTARRYAWLAYFHNREAMQQIARTELEGIVAQSISAVR